MSAIYIGPASAAIIARARILEAGRVRRSRHVPGHAGALMLHCELHSRGSPGRCETCGEIFPLLDLADDEVYRRSLLIQVNTGERRHGPVSQGRRGQLRQAYRECQEDQLGALGLVLNAIVVWNTRYMGLALDDLRGDGLPINPEDVERLSPMVHHHIHLDGRYTFTLPESLAHGQLRPLRDPNDPAGQVFDLMAASP